MRRQYTIYSNIITMLTKYRELTLDRAPLEYDSFAQEMNLQDYVMIHGTCDKSNIRGAIDNYTFFIQPSNYSTKSADFKKLVAKLPEPAPNTLRNIVVITKEKLSSHIHKAVIRQMDPAVYVENYTYEIFHFNIMSMNQVGTHTIVNINDMLREWYTDKSCLPRIVATEPACAWIGARPGMIIKIEQLSETIAFADDYRRCIPERAIEEEDGENAQ